MNEGYCLLTILHSEWPKLNGEFVIPSAIWLKATHILISDLHNAFSMYKMGNIENFDKISWSLKIKYLQLSHEKMAVIQSYKGPRSQGL